MILKKSNFLFYILIVFTFAYAESELDTLIQEVYSGDIEKATSSIGRLKKEFPDNPALLFLEAMIDNNPEEGNMDTKLAFLDPPPWPRRPRRSTDHAA